jgi:hypothetical protein
MRTGTTATGKSPIMFREPAWDACSRSGGPEAAGLSAREAWFRIAGRSDGQSLGPRRRESLQAAKTILAATDVFARNWLITKRFFLLWHATCFELTVRTFILGRKGVQMKSSIMKSVLFAVTVVCFSGAAQSAPMFANVTLNPALSQAGFNNEVVCDGPGFPPCTGSYAGPTFYTVTFSNPGFFSASISTSVVDPGGPAAFSGVSFTVFNPSAVNVCNLCTNLSNLAVITGIYTIQVNWTFTGSPTASSANWQMPLTTGPQVLHNPEPGTLLLLGIGLLGAAVVGRRKMS